MTVSDVFGAFRKSIYFKELPWPRAAIKIKSQFSKFKVSFRNSKIKSRLSKIECWTWKSKVDIRKSKVNFRNLNIKSQIWEERRGAGEERGGWGGDFHPPPLSPAKSRSWRAGQYFIFTNLAPFWESLQPTIHFSITGQCLFACRK